ncbi:alpha/beta fold hydrolase [Capnocytophaga sp. oral taxon 338]|uniref:alpha/beta fold hydrolase n=1 Tax=Capnocytophaga sp. oral taxon 338 TaxID=710239 RepID=UPI000202C61C|nr:alpha/beta hydrolase [Capnocytophaga sp. oral taxon 338]EGD33930.1 alpha/beta hydrolase fold family hydrolase [Capnocytophaga sp. oral taxon 338 str. F0234]
MKNSIITFLFLLFILPLSSYGQVPFSVQKIGNKGNSILFIPGLACSSEVWQDTVKELSSNHTCYLLTLAGFAGTPPVKNPSVEYWANTIISYIKKEKIKNPVIVGHSLGGMLAMKIGAKAPKLFQKIVVVDALPALAALSNDNFKVDPNKDCTPTIKELTSMSKEAFQQAQTSSMVYYTENKEKVPQIVQWSVDSDRGTIAKMVCELSNTDLREEIQQIQVPTLVLLESVFSFSKNKIEQQYAKLPKKELRYANKGLHFIMYDDYDWYIQQLKEFIQ